jgi:hypothetical protein
MSLIAKAESNSGFTPVPPGMHLARCYRIIDLGTQKSSYKGVEKHLHKIMMQFEVHGEDDEGNPLLTEKGEPLSISKNYTLSLAEKATLSIDLESWRGSAFTAEERRGFELKKLLGVWAMISVSKSLGADGKEYTNIANINPVPSNIKKAGLPEGINDLKLFSIDEPDMDLFASFGDKLRAKIESSPEWQRRSGKKTDGFEDDDIDF